MTGILAPHPYSPYFSLPLLFQNRSAPVGHLEQELRLGKWGLREEAKGDVAQERRQKLLESHAGST